jgi:thiosulfate/3-mercaptopyruvate sulfurtransferase
MRKLASAMVCAALVLAAAEMATVKPAEVAARLSAKPSIFQVGPNVMYRSHRIPGAAYAGPGSSAAGLALLKTAVEKLPRDREIVLYCGCCPWDKCPNVKPAMELLHSMGFKNAKTMYIAENFKNDWMDKGYPVE